MSITIQELGICITAIISIISLIISCMNYWRNKPKLKIIINNPEYDCYFGIPNCESGKIKRYAGIVTINIINNSPVAISINSANMKVKKDILTLADKDVDYWKEISFYFYDENGEWTYNGTCLNYELCGLSFPYKIGAYDTVSAVLVFTCFPSQYKKKCKSKIVLNTAIGRITKIAILHEYDRNFRDEFERDLEKFSNSIIK